MMLDIDTLHPSSFIHVYLYLMYLVSFGDHQFCPFFWRMANFMRSLAAAAPRLKDVWVKDAQENITRFTQLGWQSVAQDRTLCTATAVVDETLYRYPAWLDHARWCYPEGNSSWVKLVTCITVIFLCCKRYAMGKSMKKISCFNHVQWCADCVLEVS